MKLRDYQRDAVNSIFQYYDDGNSGNPIISAATGAGKSIIIAEFVKQVLQAYPNERIVMATHVASLVSQNYQKIISQWPEAPAGIYSAGLGKRQPWQSVVCVSIQSIYKKAHILGKRAFLIVDESHLLSPKDDGMYMTLIAELKKQNPYLKVIGFSATPWREKGGSLINQKNAIFTDIIKDISFGYLVKRGFLSPLISKSSLIQGDLSKFEKLKGEFTAAQMENAMDNEKLTKAAIAEVEQLAVDRNHFMFFCAGIQHSYNVLDELKLRGWDADVITGETPENERARLLDKFRKSKTRYALVNNQVLTTGTDLPNADCLVLLRPTKSSSLYIQICGRGARPIYAAGYDLETDNGRISAIASGAKKNCLVLDYAGNIERFGAVDLIQMPYSRDKSSDDGKPSIPPQKTCPKCREPVHISARECHCGYEFQFDEQLKHTHAASNAAIMSSEIKPEKFNISKVIYKTHVAASGYPTLRVQYYDHFGFIASEYVPFSNPKGRQFAINWARCRDVNEEIKDTNQAFSMREKFTTPKAIYTKKSGKYTQITGFEF
jgi:DNA repair protein RadD